MKKKIVAIMMMAALALSTAACGSDGRSGGGTQTGSTVEDSHLHLKLQTKINHSYGLTVSLLTVLQENWIRQLLTLTKILTM